MATEREIEKADALHTSNAGKWYYIDAYQLDCDF